MGSGNRYGPLGEEIEDAFESAGHPPGMERVLVGVIDARDGDGAVGIRRKVTVDSGAAVSACPNKFGGESPNNGGVRVASGTEIRQ